VYKWYQGFDRHAGSHIAPDPTAPQTLQFWPMPPRIAKLAAFGAFGAVGLFVLIYAVITVASAPRRTGGIDWTEATVTWISVGLAILALIAVHVVIARGLFAIARGDRRPL